MKLKGISKLVLAGTALAATAATLTTATYAWYVTNANVDVLGASGSVASAETSGNLLVAQNSIVEVGETPHNEDRPAAYKVGLSSLNQDSIAQSDNLVPQTKATGDVYRYTIAQAFATDTTYYTKQESGLYEAATPQPTADTFGAGTYYTQSADPIASEGDWVKADGSEISGTLLTYKFWLKATATNGAETVAVTPTLKVVNNTADVNAIKQEAYSGTAGVNQGQTFAVDAVLALRMTVTTTTLESSALQTPTTVVNAGSVADIASGYERLAGTVDPEASGMTDYDANIYYKEIMGEVGYGTKTSATPYGQSITPSVTSWGAMNLKSGVDTLLTISFWLEGTDESCYDSCMAQSFKFDFNFTI